MNAGPMGSFAYAQVRQQARLAATFASADLQRLRATRDLPSLLQTARSLPFARHVERLAPAMGVHDLERRLRDEWRADVHEVARWQPAAWRDAIEWLRWLAYLPLLQKLARGGRAPPWSRSDPLLGPLVAADPRQRVAALSGTALAPFAPAFATDDIAVIEAWLQHWRGLWPRNAGATRGLEKIVARAAELDAALRNAAPSSSADVPLQHFGEQLLRVFRRNPLSPAAAVAYLGLDALSLMALRGAAAARALCAGSSP
jgi:hypothetical protein